MIKLVFQCNKCKRKECFINPDSTLEQPFCDKCYRPMFLIQTEVNT